MNQILNFVLLSYIGSQEIILTIVLLIVLILLFLALRKFVCWYYKINKRIELMEETNQLLKKITIKSPEEETSDVEKNK
jgi:hypothetical protein